MPYARAEPRAVADLLNAEVHYGSEATKDTILRTDAHGFDVIHVACHGIFKESDPKHSGLLLAPNDIVTTEELAGLELNADLVTLSACRSGLNQQRPGDELIGLTRALVNAGTASIIVSLWAVDDLSTAILMRHFYAALASGTHNKAQALQAAQLHVMRLTAAEVVSHCDENLARAGLGERERLRLLQDRADAARTQGVVDLRHRDIQPSMSQSPGARDHTATPFRHPRSWAPFVLIGDWS